ncbi:MULTISPECIES: ribosome modulation factor [Pseudomonas]|uniref:Ribosome modulation factor n=2 Tax=Pseudomonadaceae TaxID=135621 RepID=A0A0D0KAF0_9PSED|nr:MULTISPECIES: ribosome modulation factor [Pseudomonas]KIQ05733.1 hypothetical protein RU08_03080 [Pseudomonas fulva]MCW2294551.1 ribosome modulation factor [Pseudomonas sp. BIGb0408]NYH76175.1 ribosome modulation factor [Pseudomonas flavescens]
MNHREKDQHWSLESLTKAYQQGYMAGLAGHSSDAQPFADSVPAAAWEAGWVDGEGQRRLSAEKINRAAPNPSTTKKRA